MYADRVDAASRTSIQDRLNGNTTVNHVRRRQISGKRQREDDDKWEHDLFDGEQPQVSKRRIGSFDLRLKLQKKSIQQSVQSVIGVRDLRDKLSGTVRSQSMKADLPNTRPKPKSKPKPKPASEVSRITKKSVVSEAPALVKKTESGSGSKKKAQKAESVDSFLQSLGLEKYSITFQAEEVDMTALLHMTDEDLKAMGVPMGPRKKILLALESKA